jgi:hydroxymethylpyrimidine/phosphomethylpyrimidine kinase
VTAVNAPRPPRVLAIAGSDSGGGAGLQADIKTLTVLGCYAMTAVTAVTVQDTMGVYGVYDLPPQMVTDQITHVLDDIGADAIKIGMLGSAGIAAAVGEVLALYEEIPVVLDTVMIAKGGAPLISDAGVEAMKLLLPRAALVTPNAPEAARLTGLTVETPADLIDAGIALIAMGARAALMKGGHLAGDIVTDVLITPADVHSFEAPRAETRSTHGTGCTLASACAAGLAAGLPLLDVAARAHAFVQEAIRTPPDLGRGAGPLNLLPRLSHA